MYARGMSTREIAGHLRDLYGIEVLAELISMVTDAVIEEVTTWQNRPLCIFRRNPPSDLGFFRTSNAHEIRVYRWVVVLCVFCRHRSAVGLIMQRLEPAAGAAYFHRFRPVVFIETDRPCSRKPDSRFHDFDHGFLCSKVRKATRSCQGKG
jgi:hypothetical protein